MVTVEMIFEVGEDVAAAAAGLPKTCGHRLRII